MIKKMFYIIFIVLLFFSCGDKTKKKKYLYKNDFAIVYSDIKDMKELEKEPIRIKVPDSFVNLNVDNMIKEMRYIALETNENSIIGRIDKLLIFNELIFILDKSFTQSIFIFDMEGNHLKTICKKGRGPEEYIKITDFDLRSDSLIIYDEFGMKLLFLDQQGEFISMKKVGFRFKSFASFLNGDYLIATRNAQNYFSKEICNYGLLIGDPTENIKTRGFINNSFLENYKQSIKNHIVRFKETFLFSPFLSNFIYQINDDGSYFQKFELAFTNQLPINFYEKVEPMNFDKFVEKNNYSYFMGTFFENENHLFVRFNPPGNYYGYLIYEKHNSKATCYDSFSSSENLFLGYSSPIGIYEEYFVGYIEPHNILDRKRELLKTHKNSQEIISLINSLKPNNNPILIFYSYK